MTATGSALVIHRGGPSEPSSVAAIVGLAKADARSATGTGALQVWRAQSAAGAVVVAESPSAFAMPSDAHTVRLGGTPVWVARRGEVHLLCVMSPRHALLAGAVPDAELAAVARAYGLLS